MEDIKNKIIVGSSFCNSKLVRNFKLQSLVFLSLILSKLSVHILSQSKYIEPYNDMVKSEMLRDIFCVVTIVVVFVMIYWCGVYAMAFYSKINKGRMNKILYLAIESFVTVVLLIMISV